MNNRKILVVDTSVLLHDPASIHSFKNSEVVLPLIVLEELDRFKDGQNLLGSSARYINRYLDSLRSRGKLWEGIEIEGSQKITVENNLRPGAAKLPHGLDPMKGDNQIIAVALSLKEKNPDRTLKIITKDINLRLKCDALEIIAEDYNKDHITAIREGQSMYSGWRNLVLPAKMINEIHERGSVTLLENFDLIQNEFVVATSDQSDKQSALAIFKNDELRKIDDPKCGVVAKSKEQRFALHMLCDKSIPLVSLSGLAGSGKTFLTLAAAMQGLNEKKYKRIIITRSIEPVGKEIGFLPGDLDDKMSPWIAPIVDNFTQIYKDTRYFEMMRTKGDIEIVPLAFIRGRTFNDSFIIVDEAQNTTAHELKTIITRTGLGSKIVLLGDTDQIDTPYIDRHNNGLTIAVEKMKSSHLTAHITLEKGERSELATLASEVL